MRLGDGCARYFVVKPFQILTYGPLAQYRVLPDVRLIARHGQFGACLSLNDAGVYGEAFALDQTGHHAGAHDLVEHPASRLKA